MPANKERYATDPEYRQKILARNAAWQKAKRERKPDTRDRSERNKHCVTPTTAPKLGRILGLKCGWAAKHHGGFMR